MEIKINIDEKEVQRLVTDIIARTIVSERDFKIGVRDGVDKAIRAYLYKEKDNIIERVVERATVEIVKKGLPKLLERLGGVE